VTELTLIFVFQASGILLSLALARLPSPHAALGSVRRICAAVERAASSFLARAAVRLAIAVALGALLAAGVGLAAGKPALAALAALAVCFGAALAGVSTWVAATLFARSSGPALAAAERRFDSTLVTSFTPAGAAGVLAQALGALGALALYFVEARVRAAAGDSASETASALPAYWLGAGLSAFIAEGAAGTYRSAAEGGLAAAARDRALTAWDPRNPALVSGLVGETLGAGARAALLTATSAGATAVMLVLSTQLTAVPHEQLRVAALPIVLLAFGLIASATGVWVARPLEAEGAGPALLRGQASATAIWLLGLAGACYWLVPSGFVGLVGAGALGLAASVLVTYALLAVSQRTSPIARDVADGLRAGSSAATVGSLAGGLAFAGAALALGGAAALGAQAAGHGSSLAHGAALGLIVALAGALALAPYAFAVDSLAGAAATARAVGSVCGADADTARRVARLAESTELPAGLARAALFLGASLAALAACLSPRAAGAATAAEATPATALLGCLALFGAACLLVQAALVARRAARAAREVTLEVERQLASAPPGTRETGDNGVTSYRACEELCGRLGLAGALPLATVGAALPVVLGIGLVLVYRIGSPRLAADAPAMFVAGVAVTALGAALTVDGAHAVLAAARRASRPEADSATFAASVTGDALLSLLSIAIGPTVCSLALIAASLALLVWPLFP
jgi:hypothetical protein